MAAKRTAAGHRDRVLHAVVVVVPPTVRPSVERVGGTTRYELRELDASRCSRERATPLFRRDHAGEVVDREVRRIPTIEEVVFLRRHESEAGTRGTRHGLTRAADGAGVRVIERDRVVGERAARVVVRISRIAREALVAHVAQRRLEPRHGPHAGVEGVGALTATQRGVEIALGIRRAAIAARVALRGQHRIRGVVEVERGVLTADTTVEEARRGAEVQRVVVDARAVHGRRLVDHLHLVILRVARSRRRKLVAVHAELEAQRIAAVERSTCAARHDGAVAELLLAIVVGDEAVHALRAKELRGIEASAGDAPVVPTERALVRVERVEPHRVLHRQLAAEAF